MKIDFKDFFKKFTLIDIIIIICVMLAVVVAFTQIYGEDDNQVQSVSFDSSSLGKFVEKYLSFYNNGYITKSKIIGYNSSNMEKIEVEGTVIWVDDNKANVKVLLDVNGSSILAGLATDLKEADIYIEQISLESDGYKYQNLTDVVVEPVEINSLSDLVYNFSDNLNATLTATISTDTYKSILSQRLNNEMYLKFNKPSITSKDTANTLFFIKADKNEILMANNIFGSLYGQTDSIKIRIYNCSDEDLNIIKETFVVKNIRKIT
ncbi:hypothetical protein [Methanobrevibacter curvatus]|uniref:Uncharacterized protein n=1 Tax=Methanobrevibacter curvatus TaxID=49547 RepID=A0A165ZIT4_9EURY|nr:hypothetical protein [Methanobrevibacter curvatus]KZX10789.1 hypothetical protein MBCUR_16390 [Methanobrevibacter curvatus]